MRLPDAVRRAIRTFVQAFVGLLLAQAAVLMADLDDGEINWELWKRVVLTALAAAVIASLTWLQNFLEDNVAAVPAVLKATPSTGANPVTQDPAV